MQKRDSLSRGSSPRVGRPVLLGSVGLLEVIQLLVFVLHAYILCGLRRSCRSSREGVRDGVVGLHWSGFIVFGVFVWASAASFAWLVFEVFAASEAVGAVRSSLRLLRSQGPGSSASPRPPCSGCWRRAGPCFELILGSCLRCPFNSSGSSDSGYSGCFWRPFALPSARSSAQPEPRKQLGARSSSRRGRVCAPRAFSVDRGRAASWSGK